MPFPGRQVALCPSHGSGLSPCTPSRRQRLIWEIAHSSLSFEVRSVGSGRSILGSPEEGAGTSPANTCKYLCKYLWTAKSAGALGQLPGEAGLTLGLRSCPGREGPLDSHRAGQHLPAEGKPPTSCPRMRCQPTALCSDQVIIYPLTDWGGGLRQRERGLPEVIGSSRKSSPQASMSLAPLSADVPPFPADVASALLCLQPCHVHPHRPALCGVISHQPSAEPGGQGRPSCPPGPQLRPSRFVSFSWCSAGQALLPPPWTALRLSLHEGVGSPCASRLSAAYPALRFGAPALTSGQQTGYAHPATALRSTSVPLDPQSSALAKSRHDTFPTPIHCVCGC